MPKKHGIYSILYRDPANNGSILCAVDWSWQIPGKWTRSEKDGVQWWCKWRSAGQLNNRAYRAILKHFGLKKFSAEFPMKKIIKMSPAKLAAARRRKERQLGLKERLMRSDTIGNHCSAESCN